MFSYYHSCCHLYISFCDKINKKSMRTIQYMYTPRISSCISKTADIFQEMSTKHSEFAEWFTVHLTNKRSSSIWIYSVKWRICSTFLHSWSVVHYIICATHKNKKRCFLEAAVSEIFQEMSTKHTEPQNDSPCTWFIEIVPSKI